MYIYTSKDISDFLFLKGGDRKTTLRGGHVLNDSTIDIWERIVHSMVGFVPVSSVFRT